MVVALETTSLSVIDRKLKLLPVWNRPVSISVYLPLPFIISIMLIRFDDLENMGFYYEISLMLHSAA